MDSIPFHLRPQEVQQRALDRKENSDTPIEPKIEVLHLKDIETNPEVQGALEESIGEKLTQYTPILPNDQLRQDLGKALKATNQHLRHLTELPWHHYFDSIRNSVHSYFERLL